MHIERVSVGDIRALSKRVQAETATARAYEDAAQALAKEIYKRFQESVVLARVFITVPYGKLPADIAKWVRDLASSAGVEAELTDGTPVLSLVGTQGEKSAWCDRKRSQGHVGIPLVSSSFVSNIPMISRLLFELGVPVDWIDRRDTAIVKKTIGSLAGIFHVEDAAQSVDHLGRKIIPAQDFVRDHAVATVFGVGGAYVGGSIVVFIVFCRHRFGRDVAESFLPLVNYFKSETMPLVVPSKIFRA
jgi:hypothetical protein